jgi:hypothetical protein
MATVPDTTPADRASVPRIVLPITSRGLELTDRACWAVLGAAMVASAALILYLTRGTLFYFDQLTLLFESADFSLGDAIDPDEGHLGATTRLVFQGMLEVFGADYVAFRVLHVAMAAVAAGVFYALVKRRIGAVPALAPTLVLLVLGAAWSHVLVPIGFGIMLCVAAGLGALLCLERGDRRGEIAACVLLIVSVATFTTGLAFLAAAAVAILVREDRRRRAWVFLVPAALYAAWWLWSLSSPTSAESETTLSNALLIPNWIADSLAVVISAIVGFGYEFGSDGPVPGIEPGWGRALAVAAVAVLAVRVARRGIPTALWASLAFVSVFWILGALSYGPDRLPETTRYLYTGAVGVLLVAADAARGTRFTKLAVAVLFGACAISLVTNLALLRDSGSFFRNEYSAPGRAELAMLELGRERVDPDFSIATELPGESPIGLTNPIAGTYLEVVDEYGSPAFTLEQLSGAGEGARQHADLTLARALDLRLRPAPGDTAFTDCRRTRSQAGDGPVELELPPGGGTLTALGAAYARVEVGRFGTAPSVPIGRLADGRPTVLRVPEDSSPTPWRASVSGARSVEVCPPS